MPDLERDGRRSWVGNFHPARCVTLAVGDGVGVVCLYLIDHHLHPAKMSSQDCRLNAMQSMGIAVLPVLNPHAMTALPAP